MTDIHRRNDGYFCGDQAEKLLTSLNDSFEMATEGLRRVGQALEESKRLIRSLKASPFQGKLSQESLPLPTTSLSVKSGWPIVSPAAREIEVGPSGLRIHSLGRFKVCLGDRELTGWRSQKAQGILKLLLIHLGRPLPRDVLLEAFWPDFPLQSANDAFRVALHDLRRRLVSLVGPVSPPLILTERGYYTFNPEVPIWIDFLEFEHSWKSGRACEAAGDPLKALAWFERADLLYTGEFLEEDRYVEWTMIKREGLRDVYLSTLGKLTEYHLHNSDYEMCIELSQRLLTEDQCREDAYRHLMVCYSRLGQRSDASRWFNLCQQTLRRELDCNVAPETLALHDSIVSGIRI